MRIEGENNTNFLFCYCGIPSHGHICDPGSIYLAGWFHMGPVEFLGMSWYRFVLFMKL